MVDKAANNWIVIVCQVRSHVFDLAIFPTLFPGAHGRSEVRRF